MRKLKCYGLLLILALLSTLLSSCRAVNGVPSKGGYEITDINIYKGTPAWELALAVKNQKTGTIEKIAEEEPQLLNYQDPKYGATLLLWAVGMEKYKSAEALLKLGVDPDLGATHSYGETPLLVSTGYSWIDQSANKDAKYVKLLLKYGADPNVNYLGSDVPGKKTVTEPGTSPLMNSISSGIDKSKALVEAGADINYKNKRGKTAAIEALQSERNLEYAYYLIVEKKANITEPYYRRESYGNEDPNEKLYAVDLLRNWIFDLDSKEYKMKMEIVEEFARQGVNYWDTEIREDIQEQIKKLYPDTWEEFIKKY